MKTKLEKAVCALERKCDKIEAQKSALLYRLGWEYRCDYPDCCWRWSKVFDGKTITDNTNGAFSMEVRMAYR